MRKASMVLGITGGSLALLIAIISLIFSLAVLSSIPNILDDALEFSGEYYGGNFNFDGGEFSFDGDFGSYYPETFQSIQSLATGWIVVSHIIAMVGGVLGIVSGALVKKHNVVAGVLMIVACVLAGFTGWGIFCSIALLVGGILALVKQKPAQAAQTYPYSGYAQPPYNPYQPPQAPPPYNPYQPPQAPPPYNPYQPPQAPPPQAPAEPAPAPESEAPKSAE